MEKDIDTFTQIVPEPPAERVSRKGRRSRPAAIDQDIDDSVERASVTKSSESIRNSKKDINTIEKRESMTEIKPKIEQKSGWNSERKSRKSVTDIDDRKGTIVGGSSDDVMVVIPDLMDETEQEIVTTIATAPVVRHLNQSITDLENEMQESETMLSQMNANSIPGLDLSRLIQNALVPMDQLQEDDQYWDWDVVFNQIATTIST